RRFRLEKPPVANANGSHFRHLTSAKEWLLSFGGFVANSGGSGASAPPHLRSAPRRSHEENHMHKSLVGLAAAAALGFAAVAPPAPAEAECVGWPRRARAPGGGGPRAPLAPPA